MPSASITRRTTKSGPRFHVRYRLGGRAYPITHAGSFQTLKEARIRRDLVAGDLAAGRNPAVALQALLEPLAGKVETLAVIAPRYRASRIDIVNTESLAAHLKRIIAALGDRDPHALTVADCQEFVATLAADMKPSSVRRYWSTFTLLLQFAGVKPNPARDENVRLPSIVTEEPNPPSSKQFLAILDNAPASRRLPLIVMEQTAMTPKEVHSLAWGDVDVAESKFRLKRANVKGNRSARARMVQVPEWLMEVIEDTCPLEDRIAGRKVLPGLTTDALKHAVGRACKTAGIPHFTPYDLRHRRISLWHHQGVPTKALSERAGHSRASMTLDVYSHVLLDSTELTPAELLSRCGPGVAQEG